ncbi:unnamed protein product [Rangifer tarandus platyrhynchus]|uniref:Uncharacterized protein n=1 Tax=Rangifer tarandus platyrhynchus TaxID=3082113 RepID=A0ABN8XJA9_RANTA|nr:unnamed protein product [Rangifer tarandus platyrhynchus]
MRVAPAGRLAAQCSSDISSTKHVKRNSTEDPSAVHAQTQRIEDEAFSLNRCRISGFRCSHVGKAPECELARYQVGLPGTSLSPQHSNAHGAEGTAPFQLRLFGQKPARRFAENSRTAMLNYQEETTAVREDPLCIRRDVASHAVADLVDGRADDALVATRETRGFAVLARALNPHHLQTRTRETASLTTTVPLSRYPASERAVHICCFASYMLQSPSMTVRCNGALCEPVCSKYTKERTDSSNAHRPRQQQAAEGARGLQMKFCCPCPSAEYSRYAEGWKTLVHRLQAMTGRLVHSRKAPRMIEEVDKETFPLAVARVPGDGGTRRKKRWDGLAEPGVDITPADG